MLNRKVVVKWTTITLLAKKNNNCITQSVIDKIQFLHKDYEHYSNSSPRFYVTSWIHQNLSADVICQVSNQIFTEYPGIQQKIKCASVRCCDCETHTLLWSCVTWRDQCTEIQCKWRLTSWMWQNTVQLHFTPNDTLRFTSTEAEKSDLRWAWRFNLTFFSMPAVSQGVFMKSLVT